MTFKNLFMRYKSSSRLSEEAGQALVETAVSAAFMVVILLGALELGRVAYASIEMANAARAAVQVACMNGGQFLVTGTQLSPNTPLMTMAAAADAAEVSSASLNPNNNLIVSANLSCVCANGGNATCQTTDCASSFQLVTVNVTTSAQFDPIFHIPGLLGVFTLYGHSSQQVLPQ